MQLFLSLSLYFLSLSLSQQEVLTWAPPDFIQLILITIYCNIYIYLFVTMRWWCLSKLRAISWSLYYISFIIPLLQNNIKTVKKRAKVFSISLSLSFLNAKKNIFIPFFTHFSPSFDVERSLPNFLRLITSYRNISWFNEAVVFENNPSKWA